MFPFLLSLSPSIKLTAVFPFLLSQGCEPGWQTWSWSTASHCLLRSQYPCHQNGLSPPAAWISYRSLHISYWKWMYIAILFCELRKWKDVCLMIVWKPKELFELLPDFLSSSIGVGIGNQLLPVDIANLLLPFLSSWNVWEQAQYHMLIETDVLNTRINSILIPSPFCSFLLSHSLLSPDALSSSSQSPLHVASSHGHMTVIVALVEEGGADINLQTTETGDTPLILSVCPLLHNRCNQPNRLLVCVCEPVIEMKS